MGSKFYNELTKTKEERELENVYINHLKKHFKKDEIAYPYKCDGYLEDDIIYDDKLKILRLIMEFKFGTDLDDKYNVSNILIQVIYYLKKFKDGINKDYSEIPNVILVGDKKACFLLHSKYLEKYLNYELDWTIAPSKAYIYNINIVKEIEKEIYDNKINLDYFDIKSDFKFDKIIIDIKRILINYDSKIKITENNIAEIYDYFINKIIANPREYTAQELVYFFINVITDNLDTFIHGKRKNLLLVRDNKIQIREWDYNNFIANYNIRYSLVEENDFNSIKDRLIEDTQRRYNGEFYTPTLWANEANKELGSILGENYKKEFLVWDCAWGTGNLTRDYYFENLFCSTLNKEDLNLGEGYNKNSIKFQFDFLEDGIEENKVLFPKEIEAQLKENNKILFFINPPFAEASNGKFKNKIDKRNTSKTKIRECMIKYGFKEESQQLYCQFLFRILKFKLDYKLDNLYIGIFTPLLFFTGKRFDDFRQLFFKYFKFESGFLFKASNFADVSKEWGVAFSIFSSGENIDNKNFLFKIKDLNNIGKIKEIDSKIYYNLEIEERCSNWIKDRKIKNEKENILLKSSLNYENQTRIVDEDDLGYLLNDSNNVYANAQGVYILSCPVKRHIKCTPITKYNYEKCFSLFAARRLIKSDWIIQKLEYKIPDENHEDYKEWVGDSIIYSLFESKSMQSSLRNIKVDNKNYDICNSFFFMSNKEIKSLANKFNNREIYNDCIKYPNEKFIYEILENYKLSKEAEHVLDKAKELVILSFNDRDNFNKISPEYNINTWDTGWYQIKNLLKKYHMNELEEFNIIFKKLEDKNINNVYKFGFLNNN